jgi:hypothetical protein
MVCSQIYYFDKTIQIKAIFVCKDYMAHPCRRSCDNKTVPMVCEYTFTFKLLSTLGPDCADCPFNRSSCFLPNCIPTNGVLRPIALANHMLPGPAIYLCAGDTIQVHIHNELKEKTSIHWHRMSLKDTPWMDGTSWVTQCPILPNTDFNYRQNRNICYCRKKIN